MGQLWVGKSFDASGVGVHKNLIFSVKTHLFCLQSDCHVQRSGTEVFFQKYFLQCSQTILFPDFQISAAYPRLPAFCNQVQTTQPPIITKPVKTNRIVRGLDDILQRMP